MNNEKQAVHDFWDDTSCGEVLYLADTNKAGYPMQAIARYDLEGEMIFGLAKFEQAKGPIRYLLQGL
mgnify:CR=1 FL=1